MNILAVIIAYLLGSIPFGYIVSKFWKGINILEHGSGNIGFTNVLRTIGWPPAAVVLAGDIGKGAVAAWMGLLISAPFGIFCGIAAMLGHSYSIFLKFRGGKMVATSLGVLLVLTPKTAFVAIIVWLITLGLTRYVSLASILAGIGVIPAMFYFKEPDTLKVFLAVAAAFIIFRHRANIGRLLNG
ncbi:MAG TPA: glycerol-3-phosphate 1-O-acyltransferase PlsY, partial [Desulfobacteria bacterium]|nr:glycerol-3-phosphate 1-O-acyltransferase PlsY [Desulfobacteria bacterium]